MDNRPIGVFDSGLGGLTGVRELRKRLPNENIVYFGDTGRVPYGVIGTAATIRSRSYETVLRKLVPGVEITARPCPLFVPLVEAGYVDHSALDKQQVTRLVIAQYLAEVREAGVDTLILGCTHYPLIKEMIGWYMGRNVTLVDPAQTAAHHLERTLSEHGLKGNHEKGEAHFYVSDVPDSFAQTADLFLGEYKGGLIDQIAIDKY